MRKSIFVIVFLMLAMLACNLSLPNSDVAPASATVEPTTVIYVVIEPSATVTVAVTDTPLPTATESLPPEVTLIKNSNCRKGPSNYYYILDQIAIDTVLPVVAQSEDGVWLQVINATNRECWIFNENVEPNSDFSALPIKEGPPLPGTPGNFFVTDQFCQIGLLKFSVSFSWVSGGEETGFRMFRNGNQIIELKASKFNYKDINAPVKKNLSYELEAFNENGTSVRGIQIVPACK